MLVIAGSDSSGGAGIQADIKTLQALDVYGATVVTSVTSQNSQGVLDRYDLPASSIISQFQAAVAEMEFSAVKVGMLARGKTVRVVADLLIKAGLKNIVLDPVLEAHAGGDLMVKNGYQEYLKWIWPLAEVVTPNSFEAEQLLHIEIKDLEDQKKAAQKACLLGAKAAVIKGGHLAGKTVKDLLFAGNFYTFSARDVGYKAHGAGCCFSSAIAAFLARGLTIPEAVEKAHAFTQQAIKMATAQGRGWQVINPC